jgi:hypothetical protein
MLHTTAQAKGGLRPPLHFVVIPSGETIASPDTGRVGLVRYPVGGQNQHSDWRTRATFVQPVSFLFANHVPSSRGLLACRRAMMGVQPWPDQSGADGWSQRLPRGRHESKPGAPDHR